MTQSSHDRSVAKEGDYEFKTFFIELQEKYNIWFFDQKKNTVKALSQLVTESQPFIFELNVQLH